MKKIKTVVKKILKPSSQPESLGRQRSFKVQENGIPRRNYESYSEYIEHQKEKLGKNIESIRQHDEEYEVLVTERYKQFLAKDKGNSILSLAARLGGEVRAFKNLGLLSVGIDLEPGDLNNYVLHGDFHDLQFSDEVFDYAFCNALDHVFDLKKLLKETHRILKPNGEFIIELALVNPSNYESIDTSQFDRIHAIISEYFSLSMKKEVLNKTSYGQWEGLELHYKKN